MCWSALCWDEGWPGWHCPALQTHVCYKRGSRLEPILHFLEWGDQGLWEPSGPALPPAQMLSIPKVGDQHLSEQKNKQEGSPRRPQAPTGRVLWCQWARSTALSLYTPPNPHQHLFSWIPHPTSLGIPGWQGLNFSTFSMFTTKYNRQTLWRTQTQLISC